MVRTYDVDPTVSDALPTTAPVLSDWQSTFGLTITGSDPQNPSATYMIRAVVTKVTKTSTIQLGAAQSIPYIQQEALRGLWYQPWHQAWERFLYKEPSVLSMLRHLHT
jgi:hypothetical protein